MRLESYCGLACVKCDMYRMKMCKGCKLKKLDWGCPIRKCAIQKGVSDCVQCDVKECEKYKKKIYKVARPFMQFDLEKNRKEKLRGREIEFSNYQEGQDEVVSE